MSKNIMPTIQNTGPREHTVSRAVLTQHSHIYCTCLEVRLLVTNRKHNYNVKHLLWPLALKNRELKVTFLVCTFHINNTSWRKESLYPNIVRRIVFTPKTKQNSGEDWCYCCTDCVAMSIHFNFRLISS